MRFFSVWVYMTWNNALADMARYAAALAGFRGRLAGIALRRMDYRRYLRLRRQLHRLSLLPRGRRYRSAVAAANYRSLLGNADALNFSWLMQRRRLLDFSAVYAKNPALLGQLARCSARLNQVVEPLHRSGAPVILAPMHTVSDVLAALVGAGAYPGLATVVVSGDVQEHLRQAPEWQARLELCSIHDDQRLIAGQLTQAMLAAADHRRNIILFPDITPDYTLNSNKDPSAKLACRLFDRPAHLHSGIARLSRALRAQVVFYALYYDDGIHIQIEAPVAAENIRRALPEVVERTMVRHADDWLLWHSHSLFFINE
ncbi:Uncharacterised protein [Serratia entomophila]|uniref:ABC transporter n=2 Tax=Serratia entomophila TaxID=42906 RepID=UPI00217CA7F7|nr:ABC transporter [Serratia entomophila]CAI1003261.1 Uncharacterised protein [Serratia entomophila]CAI1557317.1 Uncharacterised protein [Serratia entomophila]CAI1652870.1 Uncharacterised protein [Serratia entomophila]CAI1709697.1 Uncharacterised protein [Serratia entomophila]CAI1794399.1 Uncharacterised protein [Serratia entomophila]